MKADLERFQELFQEATKAIEKEYFQLPEAGREDPRYRERVYCYELYHQMREIWGKFPYSLCGEVDKGGHALIRGDCLDRVKPDFLVHSPGKMDRNLVVVEVKPVTARPEEIRRDLGKLTAFTKQGQYRIAYYLLYGKPRRKTIITRISDALLGGNKKRRIDLSRIEIYHHAAVGKAAILICSKGTVI